MKIFTLSLLFVFTAAFAIAQDSIPNGGFEQWTNGGGVPAFAGWNSANPFTGPTVIATSPDSTTVHSGNYSAKLTTKSEGGYIVPGLLTTGAIDVATFGIKGGIPIHSRPVSLTGWYQYAPHNNSDTAIISINLLNVDSQLIGTGFLNILATTTGWTQFTVPITYDSATVPVTSQVTITSSGYHGTVGSILYVDDVNYSYNPLGIEEIADKNLTVYPNPTSGQFIIDNSQLQAKTLNLFSVDGKLVKTSQLSEGINTLDAAGLSTGLYVIKIVDNTGLAHSNTLVIEK
jgi:Secretion system C-terminal sorting domain/Putative carbohydrate metabolism domain